MKMTFQDSHLKTRWLALKIGLNAKKRDRGQWEIIAAVDASSYFLSASPLNPFEMAQPNQSVNSSPFSTFGSPNILSYY